MIYCSGYQMGDRQFYLLFPPTQAIEELFHTQLLYRLVTKPFRAQITSLFIFNAALINQPTFLFYPFFVLLDLYIEGTFLLYL